jgi:hypothetical protein
VGTWAVFSDVCGKPSAMFMTVTKYPVYKFDSFLYYKRTPTLPFFFISSFLPLTTTKALERACPKPGMLL